MGKYDKIEGARDVNGDVTPTTLKPIEKVSSNEWDEMSVGELQHQRGVLFGRMTIAQQYNPALLPVMRQGIAQLDAIIASKTTDDIGLM